MEAWKQYIPALREINVFIKELDSPIRAEAFKFLANQLVGMPSSDEHLRETKNEVPASAVGRGIAPQELIRKCGAENLTDKGITLIYWLEIYKGQTSFTSSDVKAVFESARERSPSNPSELIGRLEAAGKIMKTDGVGKTQSYRLTSTGITEVEKWLVMEGTGTSKGEK